MIDKTLRGDYSPVQVASLVRTSPYVTDDDVKRLGFIANARNFFEGYHWEQLPQYEGAQLTFNFSRAFVNKFAAFELGRAFSFTVHKAMDGVAVSDDERTLFEYLEDVWEDNNQYALATKIGIEKSITGDAWIEVLYKLPDDVNNVFGEYDDGRIVVVLHPAEHVFASFNPHTGDLEQVAIVYEYEADNIDPRFPTVKPKTSTRRYSKVYTADTITTDKGDGNAPIVVENVYGVIPFAHIPNLPLSDTPLGYSDLADIIPLNTEFNLKASNISDIIDYHAAPVTLLFGAKLGSLEKGANKLWAGLPKDARVENLEMGSQLGASNVYLDVVKSAMNIVSGVPASAIGEQQAVSNTSGVAFQYLNMPLIERVNFKKLNTESGLEYVDKLILLLSVYHGLVTIPADVARRDFYWNAVTLNSTLPKDELMELQRIQQEMSLNLESVRGALLRLGVEDVDAKIKEIEEYAPTLEPAAAQPQINSGMMNGETPIETVRKEVTGENGTQG